MTRIIGSTYEIVEQLGAGGGGIVYLAKHLRLNKQVVLKADRRKIMANPDLLRREVDVLKDLKHPYIPQVYDFFSEGETVYTAMDYIEGTSLDKALKENGRFSQPQVISWARQLLQALDYLHSPTHGTPPRGYVHSDIKPANLMLRPNGDICLIDFNISLALGEDSVIGASAGYASPEHYGLDFSFYSSLTQTRADGTVALRDEGETLTMPQADRKIRPDVRSDIYSTGATLYHLLSGRRPSKSALEVVPLTERQASPQIAQIIAKAMEPNVTLRYQTAAEMLWDLEHLHENDPRSKRWKIQVRATAVALSAMLLIGGVMTFTGLRQMEQAEQAARIEAEQTVAEQQAAKQALAAIRESESAFRYGNLSLAAQRALEALKLKSPYDAQAQLALTNALGVYDLADGFKAFQTLELPSEPLKLTLSPDGNRLAAVYAFQIVIFDMETGEKLAELPVEPSALSDIVFLDENRILYAGAGAATAYDLEADRTLWTGKAATALTLSADGTHAAAIYKDEERAYVYNTASGAIVQTVSFQGRSQRTPANDVFADPQDDLFALDKTGRYMAVSFSDGSLTVFDLKGENNLELLDPSAYTHFEGGFFDRYFAFSAWDGQESIFAVVDIVNLVQTGGFSGQTPFHLQVDEAGICISSDNLLVRIDPETGEQTELAYPDKDITTFRVCDGYAITADREQTCTVFDSRAGRLTEVSCDSSCDFLQISETYAVIGSRDGPVLRLLKRESHPETELLSYDPSYRHDEARLSGDSKTMMLFSYADLRVYSAEGDLLAEVKIPESEQVYDQQFRREGDGASYLEVIYNNGLCRAYGARDGALLWERQGEARSDTLEEEFLTDRLRIVSVPHQAPAVYDRESGEQIKTLEEDAYLTYVTQAGEYIITEYISAQGKRYGLLLNEDLETLAYLPNLCDVVGEALIFDDPSGALRQSPIYSRQELLDLSGQ